MSEKRKNSRKREEPETDRKGSSPSFLFKLYEILTESTFSDIISWDEAGKTILIKKVPEFTEKVLPKYFKHKNYSSFVRQLNMYDFHKTKEKKWDSCFTHPEFHKGCKNKIKDIHRKVGPIMVSDNGAEDGSEGKEPTIKNIDKTISDIGARIESLEKKNLDYEDLLQQYKEMSEQNEHLENIVKNLMQHIAGHATEYGDSKSLQSLKQTFQENPIKLKNEMLSFLPKSFAEYFSPAVDAVEGHPRAAHDKALLMIEPSGANKGKEREIAEEIKGDPAKEKENPKKQRFTLTLNVDENDMNMAKLSRICPDKGSRRRGRKPKESLSPASQQNGLSLPLASLPQENERVPSYVKVIEGANQENTLSNKQQQTLSGLSYSENNAENEKKVIPEDPIIPGSSQWQSLDKKSESVPLDEKVIGIKEEEDIIE